MKFADWMCPAVWLAVVGAPLGCKAPAPMVSAADTAAVSRNGDPAAIAPALAASPTAVAPAVAPSAPPTPEYPPPPCEVDLAGSLTAVAGKGETHYVFAANGDCLDPNANVVGREAVNRDDGLFSFKVFVPDGAVLTVCGSIEPSAALPNHPLPTRRYGKVDGVFRAKGTGHLRFKGLTLPIADGPERTFNTGYAR
ncbi:MAG: hypothetical protein EXR77_13155 [Myxococcales bacterium]|nr:hypothetical protein [Myxococcales bacterium]